MKNEIEAMITDITATTAEAEDYTGEDGLLYCGKCHTPKEAYFAEGKTCFGRDRHPTECDCQRAAREKQQAAESRQKHLETVEDLKRRGFTDPAMRNWTFEHDNGRNPQTETARFYVESWETMQAENIGYLFWGGVGTGKSYLAACIANALMEKEVAVCMTNFATICNELFTWADVYDTANHDERRAILQQFIKEIRVRKDYEISITLNASFNQVEQLKAVSTYDGAEIFEEISEKGA